MQAHQWKDKGKISHGANLPHSRKTFVLDAETLVSLSILENIT